MLPNSIQNLIDEFSKLPSVGSKTAARLTFYLLTKADSDIKRLGNTISNLKEGLIFCQNCYNIAESDPCKICNDMTRNEEIICVVEEPLDVIALEKTSYKGKYHVLGGVISPIDGIGPENIRIEQLIIKLQKNKKINEVIFATDPSLEGEATATYIIREIENFKKNGKINKSLKTTQIARGLPVGGDLEYTDEITLTRAIEGRREINKI